MKTDINQRLTAQEIAKRVIMVRKMQSSGDPKFSEYHQTVYDDGIWKIDLEIFAISGVIRWWVSREDKAGNYNNSLFTMYRADSGEIRYSADYQIKKDIVQRLLRTFELLEKAGIKA